MSTQPNTPKILERKDIIILSASLECPCGRLKDRAHCPICGKIRLYGMSDTVPAVIPDSGDVVKDCKTYRCIGCGEKFNDVNWYFSCHAPKKIDYASIKRNMQERIKEQWMHRIEMKERFDWNDRMKCKAQTGFDPLELRKLMISASKMKEKFISDIKSKINNVERFLKDHPDDPDGLYELDKLQRKLEKLENPEESEEET